MQVTIKDVSDKTAPNLGRYVCADMECGKHRAQVLVTKEYVRVVVNNASNRAWGGLGKTFKTVDEAVANYKTPAVREMILAAANLAS